MHKAFEGVSLAGVIEPGNIYILSERQDTCEGIDTIDGLVLIKAEEEILSLLEFIYCVMIAEDYELKAFRGIKRISKNCHQIKLLVYGKETKRNGICLEFLHRIKSFEEYSSETIERWGRAKRQD